MSRRHNIQQSTLPIKKRYPHPHCCSFLFPITASFFVSYVSRNSYVGELKRCRPIICVFLQHLRSRYVVGFSLPLRRGGGGRDEGRRWSAVAALRLQQGREGSSGESEDDAGGTGDFTAAQGHLSARGGGGGADRGVGGRVRGAGRDGRGARRRVGRRGVRRGVGGHGVRRGRRRRRRGRRGVHRGQRARNAVRLGASVQGRALGAAEGAALGGAGAVEARVARV